MGPAKHSPVLALSTGQDTRSRHFDSDPDTRTDKSTRAAAQDQRTGGITHTSCALPDLPLLTDQVCRKADSDGVTPGWAGYLPGLPILTDQAFDRENTDPEEVMGLTYTKLPATTSPSKKPPRGMIRARITVGHPA